MGSIEGREGEIEPGWREVTSRKPNITHGDTHHLRRYEDVLELMCDPENPTPMVRLHHTPFKKAKIYAKLEWYNPFGSIKDRPALNMVRQAQEKGTGAAKQPKSILHSKGPGERGPHPKAKGSPKPAARHITR